MQNMINTNKTYLGIELGSTRIKAVLIDDTYTPIANGSYSWENRYENGYWTYDMADVYAGLQACYADLAKDVQTKYNTTLTTVGAIGISGMMHGYLVFDKDGKLLTPFRTWRNTTTAEAADILREKFHFNIPQRWSIAHLYQAILNGEDHVPAIHQLTTLPLANANITDAFPGNAGAHERTQKIPMRRGIFLVKGSPQATDRGSVFHQALIRQVIR